MIREVEGTRLGGPRGKGSPSASRGPKPPIPTTIAVAEKWSKRSKKGRFSLYIGSPGSHPGYGINGARRGRSLPFHPGFSSHDYTPIWDRDRRQNCSPAHFPITTPFCNWRWPIAKTDSTQEQNSAPHPAVGAERLADVRNSSAKFGFSSSFSITSTLCVKNGISSKRFGIHSKRFDKVPPTFEPM